MVLEENLLAVAPLVEDQPVVGSNDQLELVIRELGLQGVQRVDGV